MLDLVQLGRFLKKRRINKQLTLQELSNICGVSPSYISLLERGKKNNPSVEIIRKIAHALKISDLDIDEMIRSLKLNTVRSKEGGDDSDAIEKIEGTLGDLIKKKRWEKNLTLEDLEYASGVSSSYISIIERNLKPSPSLKTLKKLAPFLDISERDILLFSEQADQDNSDEKILFFDVTGLDDEDIQFVKEQIRFLRKKANEKGQTKE